MDKKRIIIISIFVLIFVISIVVSSIYYNNKYSINFETGCEDIILTQYVNKYDTVKIPIEPTKEGFVFKEWQLNGQSFDFNTKITESIILTAKWIKEEYVIIKFESDTLEEFEDKKILKGEIIQELPNLSKEGYEFIGWFLNDELYENQQINSDAILSAKFQKNIPKYEIGDKVIIIGMYAKSSNDLVPYNKKAIGWEREILNIIEGTNFPYVVGNETGVTGFFKAESLERV